MAALSARAEATTRRTYNRPLDDAGTRFETWAQTVRRAHVDHHRRLWEGAGGNPDEGELAELESLGLDRSGLVAGRTLWLGGTEYAYTRAASQFNCSALILGSVYDMVDAFWLLLNGCGVGGKPAAGTLHGYNRPIRRLEILHSAQLATHKGDPGNAETRPTEVNGFEWRIRVGDSAQAWALALGKMLASPRGRCDKLVLDFRNVRGPGARIKGYGWICNGHEPLAAALSAVHEILNRAAGNLLDEEQIGDVFNWCGTVLSSRRAAESLVIDSTHPRAAEFGRRKREYWVKDPQRRQSNNSLLFWERPTARTLEDLLEANLDGGEPGFVNAAAARLKCPWFQLFNPCFEIMLPGFCNLVSVSLPHFGRDYAAMERAVWLMARANYRQTCVDLEDGLLQPWWHQTNEARRLCGVSLTGVAQAGWMTDYEIRRLRNAAVTGSYSMADELGLPRPKAVTTVKPEGTRSKIADTTEGIHTPLGRYVFNWVNFSTHDPLVAALDAAGYRTMPNPSDAANVLVRFPVDYSGCGFRAAGGKDVNLEPAADQLRRYLRWNNLWADHNVSATVSFDRDEIPDLARLIHDSWDSGYVATAFLRRTDPTKTAADLGHPYLPQEVVTAAEFGAYSETLRAVDWDQFHTGFHDIDEAGCSGGVCPVK